jgi:two-component sensor histidine kinase
MDIPAPRGSEADRGTTGDVPPLCEASREINDILAELGHELRSPLAAICDALHVLALDGDDAATRETVQGLMERQTQCIGRLINDLMEVSRMEHGKLHLHEARLDLAQCVARAVETVRSSIAERRHQLEISLPREPVFLNADPGRLEQVLKNLLNNATKYMEPGGRIWLTAEARGGDVVLRVRDTGIGIDREMLPHVFDSFWQVERTLDLSQGGLGIGLALVRKLVEMHGGSVSASSPGLGRGSEFVVRLPLAATSRGQYAGAKAGDRSTESPSRRISSARESGDRIACLVRSEVRSPVVGLSVSTLPVEIHGRKSDSGLPLLQTMNCNATGDPRCDLDSDVSGRNSRPPSQQQLGPRAQWRVNDSIQ